MPYGGSPSLSSDWYGRVGFDTSNGNLENLYNRLASEQTALNQLQMRREDTAVQRWADDVKKAGLNPYSFTGSGASTSSVSAPHKSALEGLIQTLTTHNSAISGMNKDTLSAVNAGIKMAFPFLALFGA